MGYIIAYVFNLIVMLCSVALSFVLMYEFYKSHFYLEFAIIAMFGFSLLLIFLSFIYSIILFDHMPKRSKK